jgi:hypothetical protein
VRHTSRLLLAAGLAVAGAALAPAGGTAPPRQAAPLAVVHFDRGALRSEAARLGRARVRQLPLAEGRVVDLELEPVPIPFQGTRFVLGRKGRPDQPLAFDPEQVTLFRGRVVGEPASNVFLALGPGAASGSIDLGGGERFRLTGRDARGRALGPGEAALVRVEAGSERPPGVPLCGSDPAFAAASGSVPPAAPSVAESGDALEPSGAESAAAALPPPTRGLRHLQLAVETDHEFWSLFGDSAAAAAYLAALYAEVSAIYVRDHQLRVDLVFARLWDDPDDLFNDVDPSPLGEFRAWWNANMGSVQRDAAQLLSGRRDYPFGGQAYLSVLCTTSAYSVVGYALGFFPDPARPSPYHYDIEVTAHELGHNSGTGHTHDSPNLVDSCDDPLTTPQRGTIMSYCSQTWSGGNSNQDLYFHTRIRQNIASHVASRSCVVLDCNVNGVRDSTDLAAGTSLDANGNAIPDECEDCNQNGILDPQDIAGPSHDLDANGVPDECQPDCNANGVPDAKDVADQTSSDAHGNLVPDECETDCNASSVSDYTEIQGAMSLDVDRDAGLDACQDCDADGTSDLAALAGGHDLWLGSGLAGAPLRRFHATTGVRTRVSTGTTLARAHDVIATADGRVFVSSADDDRVAELDAGGAYLGDLLPPGAGGLDEPAGLALTQDGRRLLVVSRGTASVLAYDLDADLLLGPLVPAGSAGLVAPFGAAIGPEGDLYVTSGGSEVLRFDGRDGGFVGRLVPAASNGGLAEARGLTFKADGNLLVASYGTDETLEFDGRSGAPLGRWALSGNESGDRLNQVSPWGVRVGPNGNVFVVRTGEAFGSGAGAGHDHGDGHGELHLTNAQVYEFDVRSGNFLRAYVSGNDHGHEFATGLAFLPGWDGDCNLSRLPDACDIASGASSDADASGVPDECELDCNANGRPDRLDVIPFGSSLDCNANHVPDECDLAAGTPGACPVACNDGVDGDGDGFADFPADPGCRGAADDSEREPGLPCDDGSDDDGDAFADFPADPGCRDPFWPLEDPLCQNGVDDDGDGGVDFDGGVSVHGSPVAPPDSYCSGPAWRNRERPPACGLGFELAPAILLLARRRRRSPA